MTKKYHPHPTFTDIHLIPDKMEEGQVYEIEGVGRWLIADVDEGGSSLVYATFIDATDSVIYGSKTTKLRFSVKGWDAWPATGSCNDYMDAIRLKGVYYSPTEFMDESPFWDGAKYSANLPEDDPTRGRSIEEVVAYAKGYAASRKAKRIAELKKKLEYFESTDACSIPSWHEYWAYETFREGVDTMKSWMDRFKEGSERSQWINSC